MGSRTTPVGDTPDDEDDVPMVLQGERPTPTTKRAETLPPPPERVSERPTGLPAFDLPKFAKRHRASTGRGLQAVDATDERVQELSTMLQRRQFDDALRVAHAILRDRPDDMVALSSIDHCRTSLEALHAFSSAALMRTPSLAVGGPALQNLPLDHRAGFIISLVDGHSTVSLILDMCPMPRPEALGVIFGLVEDRVLILR